MSIVCGFKAMLSRCTVHPPLGLRVVRPRNARDKLAEHFVGPGLKIVQLAAVQRIVLDRCVADRWIDVVACSEC